jgi:hypothetical protein
VLIGTPYSTYDLTNKEIDNAYQTLVIYNPFSGYSDTHIIDNRQLSIMSVTDPSGTESMILSEGGTESMILSARASTDSANENLIEIESNLVKLFLTFRKQFLWQVFD